jgi:hypothetical protein
LKHGLCGHAIRAEDSAQRGREGVRVARLTVFTAKKPGMVAGEDDGPRPELFGHGHRCAMCESALPFGSGGHDDMG